MTSTLAGLADTAAALDAADPLRDYRCRFLRHDDPGIVAYLDGNSLGRPLAASAQRLAAFVTDEWAGRLIRGWDESWYELPLTIGDRLGEVVLGAAAGQTTIGDSTTVLLYKLACGALNLRPGCTEIVLDRENFPTDRYLIESIAADRGLTLRWIDVELAGGVTTDDLAAVVSERTALVVLSHVAYRSGYLIDVPAAVDVIHDAGALLLLDLCHSAGSVEVDLDGWGVDFAAGCTYKYLNGGPGSPAFAYVAARHLDEFRQPIWGWMGRHNPFEMEQGYVPAKGIRRVISGTPAIIGMLPIQDSIDLIAETGMPAIREKSVALTEFAVQSVDAVLNGRGVVVSSPRDPERRGGHITIDHPDFKAVTAALWAQGVIPDFRRPDGIRLGLSPLSTSFAEVLAGVSAVAAQLGD
ncbi:kynureninase [Gordonia sp. (in: high G+C Gram-positive bacteria)]|jgi:kynureninase|uniref:kynureninase n=1 Tax=Gordonia sp. (in: high G+C Gram-positive bacteria) TaxID=84139 RepID=UPI001D806946|nr:aminotransferase class V-fold PLP-dependent enzyme [Gordonia sp. (in: high G+C Gram-positive bacteria)]MCB1294537.1 aminotransferase class V-fold PLP-dependent enzyme [Gordonia sp. (in: high G+C Gram-positive bacteria)]HMS75448.1 aminotransferase class V-fold PLP-dependent enzyme [Gordonia sp. (in: high G+C Gram-positive bacteria)]HQV18806.1 aminotransferase class V-fold PLP-dependent enzyme [Gordonia sp. (in: high G+C Gram-positive bacteria)]